MKTVRSQSTWRRWIGTLAAGCAVLLSGAASHAAILYSNFPPFTGSIGLVQGPQDPMGTESLAFSFVPTTTGLATGFDVALAINIDVTTLSAQLFPNIGNSPNIGNTPIALTFGSLNVSGVALSGSIVSGSFASPVNLNAGQTYWLALSALNGISIGWTSTSQVYPTYFASSADNITWIVQPNLEPHGGAFQINSTPEPGTLSLLAGSGLSALVLLKRRARTSK